MTALLPCAQDIAGIKVTETPSGEGFRAICISWLDASKMPRSETFRGINAHRVHADLAACTAISEPARAAYLIGLCRLFGMIAEKDLSL
ncbi:MAG TPA: hypothetical protein VHZ78_08755 [Rhizomicrobium sp.]|nr:hypothetical protein [Rhizomicrobium sp.]